MSVKITFSQHSLDVIFERKIKKSWIYDVIENYSLKKVVSSDEIHYFKTIFEAENRCLKVVLNPKTKNLITVYFDRNMRKKGCS